MLDVLANVMNNSWSRQRLALCLALLVVLSLHCIVALPEAHSTANAASGVAQQGASSTAHKVTIVSAFYNITSKYDMKRYEMWMSQALSIHSDLLFFYENEAIRTFVAGVRAKVPAATTFVLRPLTDGNFSLLTAEMGGDFPQRWVPELKAEHCPNLLYARIASSKPSLVAAAALHPGTSRSDWRAPSRRHAPPRRLLSALARACGAEPALPAATQVRVDGCRELRVQDARGAAGRLAPRGGARRAAAGQGGVHGRANAELPRVQRHGVPVPQGDGGEGGQRDLGDVPAVPGGQCEQGRPVGVRAGPEALLAAPGWGNIIRRMYKPLGSFPDSFLLDPICATDEYDCQGNRRKPLPKPPICLDSAGVGVGPKAVTFDQVFASQKAQESYQCWRSPPCAEFTYLTAKRCQAGTARTDPQLVTPAAAELMASLFGPRGLMAGRVLAIFSMTANEDLMALACAAARAGLPVHGHLFRTDERVVRDGPEPPRQIAAEHKLAAVMAALPDGFGCGATHATRVGDGTILTNVNCVYRESELKLVEGVADVIAVSYLGGEHREERWKREMTPLFQHLSGFGTRPGRIGLWLDGPAQHVGAPRAGPAPGPAMPDLNRSCQCVLPSSLSREQLSAESALNMGAVEGQAAAEVRPRWAADLAAERRGVAVLPGMVLAQAAMAEQHVESTLCYNTEGPDGSMRDVNWRPGSAKCHPACDCTKQCYSAQLWERWLSDFSAALRNSSTFALADDDAASDHESDAAVVGVKAGAAAGAAAGAGVAVRAGGAGSSGADGRGGRPIQTEGGKAKGPAGNGGAREGAGRAKAAAEEAGGGDAAEDAAGAAQPAIIIV